jgi:hypothetical protein
MFPSSAAVLIGFLFLSYDSKIIIPATGFNVAVIKTSQQSQTALNNYNTVRYHRRNTRTFLYSSNNPDDRSENNNNNNDDGASLASELFKFAQQKGISLSSDDIAYDDDDDDEDDDISNTNNDDDDEAEINYPQGAINAFLGYDTGNVGDKLAGNVTLTNEKLYSEVKERVLDTAGGFLEYVKAASEEDDEDDDESEENGELAIPKPYVVPTTVPDSELTAGEVVMQVLDSLLHNDEPTKNKGVEILFGYSSEGSQIKNEIGLTVSEYAEFLKETEYKVLFNHLPGKTVIDKADYSFDGKKAYFTARLQTGSNPVSDTTSVNFILSTTGVDDDSCWLIDSFLIRPQSMRRRRRR